MKALNVVILPKYTIWYKYSNGVLSHEMVKTADLKSAVAKVIKGDMQYVSYEAIQKNVIDLSFELTLAGKNKFDTVAFEAAKTLAYGQGRSTQRRVAVNGVPTNYTGAMDWTGQAWVIGDSIADMPEGKYDRIIEGYAYLKV